MDLPGIGKWHLIDPRITGGLLGGDGPPFGIMSVDFEKKRGVCEHLFVTGSLSNVKVLSVSKFEAEYVIKAQRGKLTAQLRDDGWLTLEFTGTAKVKTTAKPIDLTHGAVAKLAILTCVTNGSWVSGPGHSALIGDRMVYSFENTSGYFDGEMSGWLVMYTNDYLDLTGNRKRPIVIQELDMGQLTTRPVMEYIHASMKDDDDYAGSGVCSQQVSKALAKGVKTGFNPRGIDTPYAVYKAAKRSGIVMRSYLIWDSAQSDKDDVAAMQKKIDEKYDGLKPLPPPTVRQW